MACFKIQSVNRIIVVIYDTNLPPDSNVKGEFYDSLHSNLLWSKLKVPVQEDAMTKLVATKRCYKDWKSEDTTRLFNIAKEARLSGRP